MRKTFAVITLALTMMVAVTGCGTFNDNMAHLEQRSIVTNLVQKVAYMQVRDAKWQAYVQQQAVQAQQQVAAVAQQIDVANQATEMALKTAEEAVKTAEELKKQVSTLPQKVIVTHEKNTSVVQVPTPEKLREEIALLKTKIKKVQNDYDAWVIVIRSSYGIEAITQVQEEIEADELALKELEQELWKKMAELKKL